jgi:hypothetical protein
MEGVLIRLYKLQKPIGHTGSNLCLQQAWEMQDLKRQERQQKEIGKSRRGGTFTAEEAEKEFMIDLNHKE